MSINTNKFISNSIRILFIPTQTQKQLSKTRLDSIRLMSTATPMHLLVLRKNRFWRKKLNDVLAELPLYIWMRLLKGRRNLYMEVEVVLVIQEQWCGCLPLGKLMRFVIRKSKGSNFLFPWCCLIRFYK